jgi:AraC-like DNA-binding protein
VRRDPRELSGAWTRFQHHGTAVPAPDLAPFVERYWTASWDYNVPYRQKIAPHPSVQVTVRHGGVPEVHGVPRRHVTRVLEGTGTVVGAQFRPGVFRRFVGAAVSTLTDRTVPAATVPGLARHPLEQASVDALQDWLRKQLPAPAPSAGGQRARAAVELAAADTDIRRVDDLAEAVGTSVRSMQRLFAEHVGIGPKWVIRRFRLHEVTERMAAGGEIDWAQLAAELGYTDQPHLIRDFGDLFGEPPAHYSRRYPHR